MKKFMLISIFSASLLLGVIIYQKITASDVTTVDTVGTADTQNIGFFDTVDDMTDVGSTTVPDGELNCIDCWLAPVDKTHFLRSDYAPTIVPHGLSGGGSLTDDAAGALKDLFVAAAEDGVILGVISVYRSYTYQDGLFRGYVDEEIAKGLTRTEAEIKANTYSAKPGTSEHQLGTTADIGCVGCAFEESSANLTAWKWLEENANDFGFVLSYPEGQTENTGYIYEPWHWRYIGDNNAKTYALQSEFTLNQWLSRLPT